MTVQEALELALEVRDLSESEAVEVMSQLMLGEVHHGLMGGFLVGMQAKGITGSELAGFARAMRSHAVPMDLGVSGLVDTCGTGGGKSTFNLSTGAALLAAAAGAKIAKHGNRAVTSKCGSADVLEAMGIPIDGTIEEQKARLEKFGFLFMFAQAHHPAVRHVAPVRKALGIRTFFNLLGPLSNPAGAKRQMIGVFQEKSMRPVADALSLLGVEHAYVVHGGDGMDEVSPSTETRYIHVWDGGTEEGSWSPSDFGISPATDADLAAGDDTEEAARILFSALAGDSAGRMNALIPNTAVALVLAGLAKNVLEGAELARQTVTSGRAISLVNEMAGKS